MYNIRLGYGCGIKATLLTASGAIFDLRKARYKGAVLMLPNGTSIPCADVSIDDVTNSVYVRLLADRELTMIGKYGIMFNLKLANGVMYSSPMVVFAEVSSDAEVEYKELNISIGVALTYLPANVAYTGASPKIGPNGTWLVYNDDLNAYEDTGEPANYAGVLGEVQSLKDIINESLTPHFITNAVKVDWETIGRNADGELCFIGAGISGPEGNIDLAILEGYLTDKGYAKLVDIADAYATKEWIESRKYITIDSVPKKISAFANDKGYLTIDALEPYAISATTLGGYGITNAYTKTETDARIFGEVKRLFEDPRFVTAAVNIDNRTIKRDGNGALYVDETALSISGGGGGGVADSVYWNNVIGKPSWIGSTKPSYTYSEISGTPDLSVYALKTSIPTKLSQLTDDVVAGNYLSTKGGTINGSITATSFIGKLTGNVTGNVSGSSGSCTGNAASATTIRINNATSNVLCPLIFVSNTTEGNKDLFVSTGKSLTFNPSTGGLSAKNFIGNLTGNADSATKLATARTIWGQSFDGTKDVTGAITVDGDATFLSKVVIGGISLRKVDNYLYLDSSLVLSGGVTMYGDDGTTVKPIWESIPFDRTTIDWVNGKWTVVGGVGSGGISEEFLNVKLQGYQPLLSTTNKLPYSLISGTPDLSVYALKTAIPTKLSQLTDDVVAGNYLSTKGGTINGSLTATSFIGNLTGNVTGNVSGSSGSCTGNAASATTIYLGNSNANGAFPVPFVSNATVGNKSLFVSTTNTLIFNPSTGGLSAKNFIGNLTGNADSATKLATARTIWGQSFDGTKDVTGNIAFAAGQKISWHNYPNAYYISSPTTETAARLEYNSYGGHTFLGGNVAIGGTTAEAKLHVHGTAKFTGDTTFSSKVVIGTIPVYQSADGTLFVDANVVFRGGVAMYGNTTTTVNEE